MQTIPRKSPTLGILSIYFKSRIKRVVCSLLLNVATTGLNPGQIFTAKHITADTLDARGEQNRSIRGALDIPHIYAEIITSEVY